MLSKYNITFKTLLPVIIASIITFIIEAFRLLYSYTYYDMSIRDFEHLLAGIIMPYMFHTFEKNSINFSCFAYTIACFVWEFGQFCMRGYFQFDQLCYDLIGILIIFLLHNLNSNSYE